MGLERSGRYLGGGRANSESGKKIRDRTWRKADEIAVAAAGGKKWMENSFTENHKPDSSNVINVLKNGSS